MRQAPLHYTPMTSPRTISLKELIDESPYAYQDEGNPYTSDDERGFAIRRPLQSHIENFKTKDWIFSYGCCEVSHGHPTSRYNFNLLNPDDYLLNWDYLTSVEKDTFKNLIYNDTYKNPNRYGLKKLNLESHLLFSLGLDMTHLLGKNKNYVLSNLKQEDSSTMFLCVNDKNLDPRSSLNTYKKFKKLYQVEKLFEENMVAYHMLITLNNQFHKIPCQEEAKKIYQDFFKRNNIFLSKLCHKKNKIASYIYSHEISVDSILNQTYRPHTHALIWVEKNKNLFQTERKLLELETRFNLQHQDKTLSLLKTSQKSTAPLKRASSYKDIEKSVQYMFRAYSLSEVYRKELSKDNIQELNLKSKETIHSLIRFFKSCAGEKSIRRFGAAKIPKSSRLQKA